MRLSVSDNVRRKRCIILRRCPHHCALLHLVGMGAKLWVHGHTHDSMAWEDGGGTLVVCNPAGYARPDGSRENAQFNPHMCVAIHESNGDWQAEIEPGVVRTRRHDATPP